VLRSASGDVFGRIYEYFLMKLDYQVFYFDKVATCGSCHACCCPILQ